VEVVRLVLVCAEPGNPYDEECYEPPSGEPGDVLRMVYTASCRHLEQPADQFAQNLRDILNMAWPGLSFEEQLRRTWITESVLCSADVEGGPVPPAVEEECANRYLRAQLALFPGARIVALGGKAQQRLQRAGLTGFERAWAASPPGCNRSEARDSWRHAVEGLP
jgi:hypothetical protein